MAINSAAGAWGKLFAGRRDFASEIGSAKEIGSEWREQPRQVDIVLDDIPGWVAPLWGADSSWLYVRRPEGQWKTRIPKIDAPGRLHILCQRSVDAEGTNGVRGGILLGAGIRGQGGWIYGAGVDAPMQASDIDDCAREAAHAIGVDAHALGKCLGPIIADDPAMLLVAAGDYFDAPPSFSMAGDWLLARDPHSGRRVAFPLAGEDTLRHAICEGRLWLRFQGLWMRPCNARVEIQQCVPKSN